MKREFLANFKVGETPLPKEIIDEIMSENGKDVESAKKAYSDYESVKDQLSIAKSELEKMKSVDVGALHGQIEALQAEIAKKDEDHKRKMSEIAFDGMIERAVTGANGRNLKAIRALLDLDSLSKSKNQESDIKTAIDQLKKDNDYLFESEKTPGAYASGTGGQTIASRYSSEEIEKMSMDEYRKHRSDHTI